MHIECLQLSYLRVPIAHSALQCLSPTLRCTQFALQIIETHRLASGVSLQSPKGECEVKGKLGDIEVKYLAAGKLSICKRCGQMFSTSGDLENHAKLCSVVTETRDRSSTISSLPTLPGARAETMSTYHDSFVTPREQSEFMSRREQSDFMSPREQSDFLSWTPSAILDYGVLAEDLLDDADATFLQWAPVSSEDMAQDERPMHTKFIKAEAAEEEQTRHCSLIRGVFEPVDDTAVRKGNETATKDPLISFTHKTISERPDVWDGYLQLNMGQLHVIYLHEPVWEILHYVSSKWLEGSRVYQQEMDNVLTHLPALCLLTSIWFLSALCFLLSAVSLLSALCPLLAPLSHLSTAVSLCSHISLLSLCSHTSLSTLCSHTSLLSLTQ